MCNGYILHRCTLMQKQTHSKRDRQISKLFVLKDIMAYSHLIDESFAEIFLFLKKHICLDEYINQGIILVIYFKLLLKQEVSVALQILHLLNDPKL